MADLDPISGMGRILSDPRVHNEPLSPTSEAVIVYSTEPQRPHRALVSKGDNLVCTWKPSGSAPLPVFFGRVTSSHPHAKIITFRRGCLWDWVTSNLQFGSPAKHGCLTTTLPSDLIFQPLSIGLEPRHADALLPRPQPIESIVRPVS